MATIPTQVRIEANVKKQANELFATLGLDMSSAINIFLIQCIMRGGLPFSVTVPPYSSKVFSAMEEAKRISRDSEVPGYSSIDELKDALEK